MSRSESRLCGRALMIWSLVTIGLSGCSSLIQPYPKKNLFAISIPPPAAPTAGPVRAVLCVQGVRIAEPYSESTFIYRTGESSFAVDYYNGFVADPDRLLTGELTGWLSRAGVFKTVVNAGSGVDYDLSLETNVTALYGDYSEKGSPKAVVEARFFLIRESGRSYDLLFQKVYRETQALQGDSPQQLVTGWDEALRRMLEALAADLRPVVPTSSRPAS